MNTIDAMQDSDCMCISLSVARPESAIADPTKLIVKDVFPTYITADTFCSPPNLTSTKKVIKHTEDLSVKIDQDKVVLNLLWELLEKILLL